MSTVGYINNLRLNQTMITPSIFRKYKLFKVYVNKALPFARKSPIVKVFDSMSQRNVPGLGMFIRRQIPINFMKMRDAEEGSLVSYQH